MCPTPRSRSLPPIWLAVVLVLVSCAFSASGEYIRPRREPPRGYPQRQSYGPPAPRYGPPSKPAFGPPKLKYGPPKMRYGPPKQLYGPPKPIYGPPKSVYGPPKRKYINPPQSNFGYQYNPPRKHQHSKFREPIKSNYGPPKPSYGAPKPSYGPPTNSYGVPIYKKPTSSYSVPDTLNSQLDSYDAPISISDSYGPPSTYSSYTHSSNFDTSLKPSTSYGTQSASQGIPASLFDNPSVSQSSSYNTKPVNSYPIPSTTYGIPSPTYGAPKAPALTAASSSHHPVATSYINVYKGTPQNPAPSQVSTDNYGAPTKGIYDTLSSSTNQQLSYHSLRQTHSPTQQSQNPGQSSSDNSSYREDDIITSASQNANTYNNLHKTQDTYNNGKLRGSNQSTKLATSIVFPTTSSEDESGASGEDGSQNSAFVSQSNVNSQQFGSFQPPSQTFGFVPYDNDSKVKGGREASYSITPSQSYYAGSSVSSAVLPANYYDTMSNQHFSQQSEDHSSSLSRRTTNQKQHVRFPENDNPDQT